MTRRTGLALVIGAVVVLAGGVWLSGVSKRDTPVARPAPRGGVEVVGRSLDDLLMGLQLVPLDRKTPQPFALESLDGQRVALADLAGRPALLYFWATW